MLNTEWGYHFVCREPKAPTNPSIYWELFQLSMYLDRAELTQGKLNFLTEVRSILAHMIVQSSNQANFTGYCLDQQWGNPSESDREQSFTWLCYYASLTGLLHAIEISNIPYLSWVARTLPSLSLTQTPVVELASTWTQQGYAIGAFPGAFDHPHATHLANATSAYLWAQDHGIPLKLIWWFDNDDLIKRKGSERPRYALDQRRSSVSGLWQVAATAILSATNPDDLMAFSYDFSNTQTSFVFTTSDIPTDPARIKTAVDAGAELVTLPSSYLNFHSSTHIFKPRK